MLISTVPIGLTISWAISGGDAAFAPGFDGSKLSNGQPASATRIKWRTDAISTGSGGTVTLTGTLSQAIPARCAALLEPELSTANLIPAGVKVTCSGKLSGGAVALGGNSATGVRTVLHPNNATRRPFVFPAATIDQILIVIWNDQNGSTWATAGELVDLGDIWVGKGADFAIKEDLKNVMQGGILQRKSHENQNWPFAIKAYDQPTFNITPMSEHDALGPRTDQADFQSVMYELTKGLTSVLIPVYLNRAGGQFHKPPAVIDSTTINDQRLCRSFLIGNLDGQGISLNGNGDQFYVSPIQFGESPP